MKSQNSYDWRILNIIHPNNKEDLKAFRKEFVKPYLKKKYRKVCIYRTY